MPKSNEITPTNEDLYNLIKSMQDQIIQLTQTVKTQEKQITQLVQTTNAQEEKINALQEKMITQVDTTEDLKAFKKHEPSFSEQLKGLMKDFPLQDLVEKKDLIALLEKLDANFNCINELTLDTTLTNENLLVDKEALVQSLDYYLFLYQKMEKFQILLLILTLRSLLPFEDSINKNIDDPGFQNLYDLMGLSILASSKTDSEDPLNIYLNETYNGLDNKKNSPQEPLSFKENSLFENASIFFRNDPSMLEKLKKLNEYYQKNHEIKEILKDLRALHRDKVAKVADNYTYYVNDFIMTFTLQDLLDEMSKQFPNLLPSSDIEIKNTPFNKTVKAGVKKTKNSLQYLMLGLDKPTVNSAVGLVASALKMIPVVGSAISQVAKGANAYDQKTTQKLLVNSNDDFNQALDLILICLTNDFFSLSHSGGVIGAQQQTKNSENNFITLANNISSFMESFFKHPNQITKAISIFKDQLNDQYTLSELIAYHFLFSLLEDKSMSHISILKKQSNQPLRTGQSSDINCNFDSVLSGLYELWKESICNSTPSRPRN